MLLNSFNPLNAHYTTLNHFPLSTLVSLFLSSSFRACRAFRIFFAFHPKLFSPSRAPRVLYLTTLC